MPAHTSDTAQAIPVPRIAAPADGRLDAAALAAYRAAGVLVIEGFESVARCEALKARIHELIDAFDPASVPSVFSTTDQEQLDDRYFIESGDKIRFFLEPDAISADGELNRPKHEALNKIGHALHDLDPVFEDFSHGPRLAALADSLGYRQPGIIQSMYIFKAPEIGGEVVCHQDSTYLYTEPESCTGFWFALEDATEENGCMHFITGAHRGPLKKRNYRVNDRQLRTDTLDESPWPEEARQPAPAPAGSLVIFDGRTPHLSGPNRSSVSRHAYTLHVIDRQCHYPADNWLQRDPSLPLRGFD